MLDIHVHEFGYVEVAPPLMVHTEIMFGTGQLPKFQDDQFETNTGHWLIPTAEVPLTNLVADEILPVSQLPLRYTALRRAFELRRGCGSRHTRNDSPAPI